MPVKRIKAAAFWALVISESSHVFCCVLPTIFSVLTLLSTAGLVSVVPAPLVGFHELMHEWEIPVILFSGFMVVVGWGLHVISQRLDCHGGGCEHEPCAPKKKLDGLLLKIATGLFAVNLVIYGVFHQGLISF